MNILNKNYDQNKDSKKPRAIVFITKRYSLYPSLEVLLKVISRVFDVTFYGPGYTDKPDWYFKNCSEAFDELGSFDAAFIDLGLYSICEYTSLADIRKYSNNFFHHTVLRCKISKNFSSDFDKLPCEKFLITVGMDPYGCSEYICGKLINFPGKIIAYPHYLMKPKEQVLALKQREQFHEKCTFFYENALQAREKDIIPYAHALGDNEFKCKKRSFKYDIFVPGCAYLNRTKMNEFLNKSDFFKVKNRSWINNLLSILHAKERGTILRRYIIQAKRAIYRKEISNCFFNYTDGSQLGYMVRKFLEIPAFGSILLADPFHNHQKMGFAAGINYLEVSEDLLEDTLLSVKGDFEYAKDLRENSFTLIRKKHSETAWVKYFMEIWSLISLGKYDKSFWDDGNLVIKSINDKKIINIENEGSK